MSYIESVLQPGERLLIAEKLHWIIYAPPIFSMLVGAGLLIVWLSPQAGKLAPWLEIVGLFLLAGGFVMLIKAWFDRWVTEFAVTTRRVVCKKGFIYRETMEMNMDKVESVTVSQPILGRILDYGSIRVLGTGQGIERLHRIASPLKLRSAIQAR